MGSTMATMASLCMFQAASRSSLMGKLSGPLVAVSRPEETTFPSPPHPPPPPSPSSSPKKDQVFTDDLGNGMPDQDVQVAQAGVDAIMKLVEKKR